MDKIDELEKKVNYLMEKRIGQADVLPDVIKMRHVGEGVRFIRSGLAADLPTTGEGTLQGSAMYYAYDTDVLYFWDGDEWKAH